MAGPVGGDKHVESCLFIANFGVSGNRVENLNSDISLVLRKLFSQSVLNAGTWIFFPAGGKGKESYEI